MKNIHVRLLRVSILFLVIFALLVSCTRNGTKQPDVPDVDVIFDIGAHIIDEEPMAIRWGVFQPKPHQQQVDPATSRIAQELNSRFNVIMDSPVLTPNTNMAGFMTALRRTGNLPDIYCPRMVFMSADSMIESGMIRAIPWEMIKRHAPNYAAMLEEGNMDGRFESDTEISSYMLPNLERSDGMLEHFSVYRLDWLEQIGIAPHGNVTNIGGNMYFTDAAFDIYEFKNIMQGFTGLFDRFGHKSYGLGLRGGDHMHGAIPLAGMWGYNFYNVNENGQAVVSFASEGFRSYLMFLEELLGMGVIYQTNGFPVFDFISGTIGWTSFDINTIMQLNNNFIDQFFSNNPNGKLLIAPPEIGPSGIQGANGNVYGQNGIGFFNGGTQYVINANVSDEKLARILEIYDAITFDPKMYIMVHYGFENENFRWTGQPHDSGIELIEENPESTGLFVTHTLDGAAGKRIFGFPSEAEPLYRFATSRQAQTMIHRPYKVDHIFVASPEFSGLNARYPLDGLMHASIEYSTAIILGEKSVAGTWDSFINDLIMLGLDEWNGYFNLLPDRN